MKTITLIRHSEALAANAGQEDIHRVLSQKGESMALAVGRRLAEQGLRPDILYSSPASRAIATCQIFCGELNYPISQVRVEPDIYYARGVEYFFKLFTGIDEAFDHLWLFGHNPYISAVASLLNAKREDFALAVCSLIRMEFDIEYWAEILPAEGCLAAFEKP